MISFSRNVFVSGIIADPCVLFCWASCTSLSWYLYLSQSVGGKFAQCIYPVSDLLTTEYLKTNTTFCRLFKLCLTIQKIKLYQKQHVHIYITETKVSGSLHTFSRSNSLCIFYYILAWICCIRLSILIFQSTSKFNPHFKKLLI